jgi:hypothetical protein
VHDPHAAHSLAAKHASIEVEQWLSPQVLQAMPPLLELDVELP